MTHVPDPLPQLPPSMLERAGRPALAVRLRAGIGPVIVFLPGYASDMCGSKALALEAWAAQQGRAMLRFDYAGCGASDGDFLAQSLADWQDDALAVIAAFVPDQPLLLVGSSMGGWLMLLVAEILAPQVVGLVGIAAAPDFTDWGFSDSDKSELLFSGCLVRRSSYDDAGQVTSLDFWESGQRLQLLDRDIAIQAPIRLLQGQQDDAVPWRIALTIVERVRSADVQAVIIKDGDHRLSRPQDIALLIDTVRGLISQD